MTLERYIGAAVAIAVLLVPLFYYRNLAVSSAVGWRVLVKVQRLSGGMGQRRSDSGSSTPEAAAEGRFAPVLDAYLRRHEAAVALLDGPDPWDNPEAATVLRLVVVQLRPQGLGNRLPSLVTGFALALLTDRVLLVDDSAGRYFGIFSPTFDCNYTQSRMAVMMAAPMYREVSTRGADAAFVLEDLTVRFKQDTVVYYSSLDYQLPLLSSNALYRRFLGELAPNFGIIGNPLLRPEPGLAAEAAELYAANVPPGSIVVGTHIRLHKRDERVPPVQWYVDTSLAVGLRNAAPERLRFFIGADDPQAIFEFKATMQSTLESDWNVTAPAVFHSSVDFRNREKAQARRNTDLIDMLVLGLCNETVLTYESSFGYVAAAMGLRPPHFQQHLYRDTVYPDSPEVFGRSKERHERVAEDHIFSWKALIAEPCYCGAKRLLTGGYSSDSEQHERLVAAFRANAHWQHYSQCCTSGTTFTFPEVQQTDQTKL